MQQNLGFLKKNPIISIIIAIIAGASSLAGTIIFIEDRYANQKDLIQLKIDIETSKKAILKSFSDIIKIQYEDSILDLEIKVQSGTATAYEKARLEHLKRRLDQLSNI